MHRLHSSHSRSKVAEEAIAEERCHRSHKLRHCEKAGVKSLVSGEFVAFKPSAPETFAVQAHIPVGEFVKHELMYGACGTCRLVVVEFFRNCLHKCVEQRKYPAVYFGTLCQGYLWFVAGKAVDIGIHREEVVCVRQGGEELARYLCNAVVVVLKVIPRRRTPYHVPAQGV